MTASVVASGDLVEGTGTRAFSAQSTLAGDWLVVEIICETNDPTSTFPVTASGLTFTIQNTVQHVSTNTHTKIYQVTAPDAAGGSRTVTVTPNTVSRWRGRISVVRNSTGVGGLAINTAGQTASLARTGVSSMVFMTVGDWAAGAVGSPAWTPGGSTIVTQQGAGATYVLGRWDDSGPTATVTTGCSSPAYGTPSVALLEMLSPAAANTEAWPAPSTPPGRTAPNGMWVNIPSIDGTATTSPAAELTTHDVVAGDVTSTQTTTDGTQPALGHTTGDPTASVGVSDTPPAIGHNTIDVVSSQTTTDGTAPADTHTTGTPAAALSVPDPTAPAIGHQTFDATVSTAVLVNVAAELTQHTVVAGDPTLSQTTQADVGNHTQITQDPSVGVGGSAGQGQTSHDAQTPSTGLTAPDVTAPANTHATATPTVAVAVPAADAANTHQALDPTVSTAVILNANAESTNHAVVAGDLASKMDMGAGASTNTHQTFDAVAGISGSAPAGDASNTHTTANTTAGFGPPAQSVSHSLVTSDVTATQTTTSGATQNAHSAFDATVSTHLQPPAFVGVDTGLTWSGTVDNAYATRASADSATTPGPAREGAARVALIEGSSAFSGLSD